MTTLLALDTATEACSVALLHVGRVPGLNAGIARLHSQRLLAMKQRMVAYAVVALSAVDAIAFGRGPGAFTGVRIAIGVVQGLAFALERPVLPVSNLAALAQGALRHHGVQQVAAAIDARMDEVYWGCYQAQEGEMRLLGQEQVLAPERAVLVPGSQGQWYGAGTGWSLRERIGASVTACDPAQLPDALDILHLATGAWARGEAVVAEQAQPVYLRDNVATPKAR